MIKGMPWFVPESSDSQSHLFPEGPATPDVFGSVHFILAAKETGHPLLCHAIIPIYLFRKIFVAESQAAFRNA